MDLKRGKQSPWLLSPSQTYKLSAVLVVCNVALLIALVHGGATNRDALVSIARAVEIEALREDRERVVPVEEAPRVRPATTTGTNEQAFRISVPEGWQWRGCRMPDSSTVDILLAIP